jgi:ribosome-binding factor A
VRKSYFFELVKKRGTSERKQASPILQNKQMSSSREQKLKDIIKEAAAEFLQRESNYTSLLTVTDVSLSDRGNQSTIFFTVLPQDKEKGALDFVKRKRAEFREYFKSKARMRALPFFDFEIDNGEKNRQKIDEIARNVIE